MSSLIRPQASNALIEHAVSGTSLSIELGGENGHRNGDWLNAQTFSFRRNGRLAYGVNGFHMEISANNTECQPEK